MQFTKYYSDLIKANGVPHLEVKQFQTLMNIVVLESKIAEHELIDKYLSGDARVMVAKRSYNCYNHLNNLTQGEKPEEVFKKIAGDYHEP